MKSYHLLAFWILLPLVALVGCNREVQSASGVRMKLVGDAVAVTCLI